MTKLDMIDLRFNRRTYSQILYHRYRPLGGRDGLVIVSAGLGSLSLALESEPLALGSPPLVLESAPLAQESAPLAQD